MQQVTKSDEFLSVLEGFPEDIKKASVLGTGIKLKPFNHIVISGMGGSNLPGEIVKNVVDRYPLTLVKDYTLPAFVDTNCLVFTISYSGNTEETLETFDEAVRRKAQIVAITSGGELEKKAKSTGMPLVLEPKGYQPRMAYTFQSITLLNILINNRFLSPINWDQIANLKPQKERAREIAGQITGKIPLIYSSARTFSVAYKWKANLNETSKTHAFCSFFPEFNHHEINAYVKLNGKYIAIFIRDKDDHPRNKKRMDILQKIITNYGVEVISIESKSGNFITRIYDNIRLGDWVSYYLALKNEVDPSEIKPVEDLKIALKSP